MIRRGSSFRLFVVGVVFLFLASACDHEFNDWPYSIDYIHDKQLDTLYPAGALKYLNVIVFDRSGKLSEKPFLNNQVCGRCTWSSTKSTLTMDCEHDGCWATGKWNYIKKPDTDGPSDFLYYLENERYRAVLRQ